MDVLTAVAFSLLPGASRSQVGACVRERAGRPSDTSIDEVTRLLAALRVPRSAFDEARAQAEPILQRAGRLGLDAVAWSDSRYPPLLTSIYDPPPLLWLRGCAAALAARAVAIVGSRAASPQALTMASRLATDLAACGVTVVSGLARGVDSASHRGALDGNGVTVAVLGSGADIIYPAEHRSLADAICDRGAIVSELPPGTPPRPQHFPLRNRLISGLTRAVVVVEAGERSGSLITARCALDQGRDVMAVPGCVPGGRNRGAHGLLKDGAKLVEGVDDILEELGWPGLVCPPVRPDGKPLTDWPLLRIMKPGESYDLDDLARETGETAARLLPQLLELELAGRVSRLGGGRFVQVAGRMVR